MDYSKFLNPVKDGDLVYLLRKIHIAAENCEGGLSLASGSPNPESVPFIKTKFYFKNGLSAEVDEDEFRESMKYQLSEGMPKLLNWIHKIHQQYHTPPILNHSNPESRYSCCVTGGAMGGMHLLFSQIIREDDVVLLDEFTFGGSLCCLKRTGAVLLEVKMDKHGATPESLVDNIKNWKNKVSELGKPNARAPKFFYTVPTGQNPTGIVVPLSRKKEIYKILQENDLLLVEDDPYYFTQYTENFSPSYQSIDVDGRVIRIDSMSKFLAAGLRLGWVTGPSAIVNRVADAQTTANISVGCLAQLIAIKIFDVWGMEGVEKRISELVNFYRPSRDVAERSVKEHLSDLVEWDKTEAGFFMWLKMKNGKDTMFVADLDLSEKHKAFAVPGVDFSSTAKSGPYIRIAFSYLDRSCLETAIKRLRSLILEAIEE